MKLTIPTPDGVFRAETRNGKLSALYFPRRKTVSSGAGSVRDRAKLGRELKAYLAGKKPRFRTALDLSDGTPFQQKVWRALLRIPYGQTRSYSEIAREIGSRRAFRAVGAACGQNPVPIFVPCHRVVAHNKKLGGFSGGLHWKKKLLAIERGAVSR